MNSVFKLSRCPALALATLLSACGGGGADDGSAGTGMLKLALTDAPACGYDRVDVTVEKVRVHRTATAADTDAGWSEVVLSPPRRVDLLTLTNGVLLELGQTPLPAGKYTQLRLVLATNDAATPLANAVTPTGARETALSTPSASQSGLKLNVDIDIAADKVADFVLDFDACKSIVKLGASGRYNLKPVIGVLPRLSDAGMRVVGYVSPMLDRSTTIVSAQQNGIVVKATPPDATGRFTLFPLPSGTYDVVVGAVGRVPATVTGVPVVDSAITTLNGSGAAIDPPVSTARMASGSVTTGAVPIEASVGVVKKYTGGPNVVVFATPVDGSTGAFVYTLATGAAVKAAYSSTVAMAFSPDTAMPTGKYTLAATFAKTTKTADIDVTAATPAATAFTFP